MIWAPKLENENLFPWKICLRYPCSLYGRDLWHKWTWIWLYPAGETPNSQLLHLANIIKNIIVSICFKFISGFLTAGILKFHLMAMWVLAFKKHKPVSWKARSTNTKPFYQLVSLVSSFRLRFRAAVKNSCCQVSFLSYLWEKYISQTLRATKSERKKVFQNPNLLRLQKFHRKKVWQFSQS